MHGIRFLERLSLALVLTIGCSQVGAQSINQLTDLNTGPNGSEFGSLGTEAVFFDGRHVFAATDRVHGLELWVTDGTAPNTRMLVDLCPGQCSGNPNNLYVEGSNLFFAGDDGKTGSELWRLPAGSDVPVQVSDLNAGAEGSSPARFSRISFVVNSSVVTRTFFTATRNDVGRELWRLNAGGSPTATLEFDINPGGGSSSIGKFGVANSQAAFTAAPDGSTREFLLLNYSTTTAVPTSITSVGGFGLSSQRRLTEELLTLGAKSYLLVSDSATLDSELYASDGTTAGTVRLFTADQITQLTLQVTLNRVFGAARNGSATSLLVSDGTTGGTSVIGTAGIAPSAMVPLSNRLFFFANSASNGRELFSSDGTTAGTGLFKDLVAGGGAVATVIGRRSSNGLRAYFGFGDQLWITDGTVANTIEVSGSAISGSGGLIAAILPTTGQSALIGFANQAFTAGEPFFTSGTAVSTVALGNLASEVGDSFPTPISVDNGRLIFVASVQNQTSNGRSMPILGGTIESLGSFSGSQSGVHFGKRWLRASSGATLTNGLPSGTTSLTGFNGELFDPDCIIERGGLVHFIATASGGASAYEIWQSDGTQAGTLPVTSLSTTENSVLSICASNFRTLVGLGDAIYFVGALSSASGLELLKLSGQNQVSQVAEIRSGSTSADIRDMMALNNRFVFTANDGIFGNELWASDGTGQGTERLTDISPGSTGSNITLLARIGQRIVFSARNSTLGNELYVTDGTVSGTTLVRDLFVGSGSGLGTSLPVRTVSDNELYFVGLSSSEPNCRLFRTNGTIAGTRCAYDSGALNLGPIMRLASTSQGALVFASKRPGSSEGEELHVMFQGQLVNLPGLDLNPGAAGSMPGDLLAAGASVVFTADNGTSGTELFRLDLPDLALIFKSGFE
ncbi:hypothetical protein [Ahniella affigens]|nr:hypothetical protein [Ahniella affigens]